MSFTRLHCFFMSGTGNTRRVAQWLAAVARARGLETQLAEVESARRAKLAPPENGDLFGVLMPTHGFTAPWPVIRFALRAPRGRSAAAFVVATRAGTKLGRFFLPGLEGTACYLVALILALKGWRVRGVLGLDMPSNWIAAHPGLNGACVAAIITKAHPTAEKFLGDILDGHRRFGAGSWVSLTLGLVLLQISLGYLLMGRFFLARLFFANNRCTSCGLCACNCPFGALKMRGRKPQRPYWTFACESCMRCMGFCPEGAIEAGHSWAIALYFAITAPFAWWLLKAGAQAACWPAPIAGSRALFWLQYPFSLLALAVAYAGFWLLVRVRWINELFTLTTFTHRWRRYHEPGTTLKALVDEHR
ncbi:MAG: (4Fe-4S)-binding protein [Verrucomicrobia bacterium]|nr:MAG: (4Fe-4S)-binding protein [Verrucomicrobiota bacterium]